MTRVLTPSWVCTVTSPWRTRRPRACRQPLPRPSAPARALALSLSALADGAWVVVVAFWAASAAPPAVTSSTPATAQPSHLVCLPSRRMRFTSWSPWVCCRRHPGPRRLAPATGAGSSLVKLPGAGLLGPEPQGGAGGLHGVVDHGPQLGVEGVQIQLVPQAGREPLHSPDRVVAAAVEAAVDQVLDPAAQRLEQRRHGQGGGGHGQAAGAFDELG